MSQPRSPLKLVDFEHYMLCDDEPDYPMVISVWLEFSGILDRQLLEQAFQETVAENPLVRSTIESKDGELYWVESSETPKFEWTESWPHLIRLDLFDSPGVKVFGKEENGNTRIRMFIHHCVADGAGIILLLDQWLTRYQNLVRRQQNSHQETQPELEIQVSNKGIENRGKFGMNFWKYILRPFQEFCGLIGVTEYFSHRPVAIGPQQTELAPAPNQSLTNKYTVLEFSEEETARVIKDSKATKNKINDMMVASILESCQAWLNEHQPDESHRHIRVMIPMDMRNKQSPEKFVANIVSMTYLDRRPNRYKSVQSICRYAWLEMSAIKMMKLGLTFVHLIRHFRKRGKLKKLLRRDRSVASTTYSNMGPVFDRSQLVNADKKICVEGARLEKLNVFPPVRPYTWINAVVVTYGNRFAVNCSWCSKALSQQDVDQILTRFKHNLLSSFSNSQSENKTEQESAVSK